MDWWNSEYVLRRQLSIALIGESIQQGYPVTYSFNRDEFVSLGKIRSDFSDIKIVYWNENLATPQWELIGHSVYYDDIGTEKVFITFNLVDEIDSDNNNYYMYSCNPTLFDAPDSPLFEDSRYIVKLTPAEGNGIMFSRPTEDWQDGVSLRSGARAAFNFYGRDFRIKVKTGPDRGIIDLYIDNQLENSYDTYSTSYEDVVIYSSADLEIDSHFVKLVASGNKSPYSKDNIIEVVSFEYSDFVDVVSINEELVTSTKATNFIIGN